MSPDWHDLTAHAHAQAPGERTLIWWMLVDTQIYIYTHTHTHTHTHTLNPSKIHNVSFHKLDSNYRQSTQNKSTQTQWYNSVTVGQSAIGTHEQTQRSHSCIICSSVLPSPYTVSSWILAVDWRLPVCNTLLFLSEMALRRFPDKTVIKTEDMTHIGFRTHGQTQIYRSISAKQWERMLDFYLIVHIYDNNWINSLRYKNLIQMTAIVWVII